MERMAILIHESMSLASRNYHSVQHVFDVIQNLTDPVCILAALFHDCVYYHVDGGLSDRQLSILRDDVTMVAVVVEQQDAASVGKPTTTTATTTGYCQLLPGWEKRDELLHMVALIFGVDQVPDQRLTPATGVNEFLSAVIAVRELEPLLPPSRLAEIACCIEATIPFRPTSPETGTPMDRLYDKMIKTRRTLPHLFEPTLAASPLDDLDRGSANEGEGDKYDPRIVRAVQRAVMLTNEDAGNFSTDDPGSFLDNTWNLLPESNEALRQEHLYTVRSFASAVHKMHAFFRHFLHPELIFQQFRGVPSDEELRIRLENAERNVQVGRKYLAAKLLSLGVLSAFAELSGGDAPVALFMGDLPSRNRFSRRLEDALVLPKLHGEGGSNDGSSQDDEGELVLRDDCDGDVYRLLSQGRKSDTSFDIRQSPLAAYLYAILGDAGVDGLVSGCLRTYPLSREGSAVLLQRLPRGTVAHVAENIAKIARSRSSRILQILKDLPPPPEEGKEALR
jgi:hypothetical protein